MFPGRYSEIFGLGERLGCILNLGHSFDAIEAYLYLLVCCYASFAKHYFFAQLCPPAIVLPVKEAFVSVLRRRGI